MRMTPAEFGKFMEQDIQKWAKVVKFSGARSTRRARETTSFCRGIWEPVAERFRLNVNGAESEIEADPGTPLLYALRNDLG